MSSRQTQPENQTRGVYLRICGHLAEETEIRSALGAVAGEIAELIPFTHADICLLENNHWTTSYEVGIKTRWSRRRTQIIFSPVREILNNQTDVMLTTNAMEDPRYIFTGASCEPIFEHQLRSRVSVKMKAMGKLIGAINISHNKEGLYDADSIQIVSQLADVLAPYFNALHNADQMRQATYQGAEARAREEGLRQGALGLTQTLEQERQRIGMDLHDQTLADLTRILRDLSGDGPVPSVPMLTARVSDCICDLRRIIDMAVPTLLELFGFAHAVRVHLERASNTDLIQIEVIDHTDNMPDRLNTMTRTALYRIVQEAINNAARHAEPSRISVVIEIDSNNHLLLKIHDNGCGFSMDHDNVPSGLAHMRTRARLIAAQFEIIEDAGTCVVVTLPLSVNDTLAEPLEYQR
ncbi:MULTISPECIES: GAF domain-containing sensor histidine kinase [Pacificibacter]|uniref:GAF domain-containing sensor histidine kinase n=1 Tax=Pacificibacter TaxID=1042323 RepID=UPI001C0907CA|nr:MULTISPECIES: ATP-binding protein [Pacificibacter]MBU2935528.1 sensor histidine kinase [Pacificibacter marinus]MDO6614025.1 ATP-binding protein [Pacificibacter sp. 1_MG-2023]